MAEGERTIHEIGIDRHVYYGTCDSGASSSDKEVVVKNPTLYEEEVEGTINYFLDLNEGDQLIVSFREGNTIKNPNIILRIDDYEDNIGTYVDSGRIVVAGQSGSFLTSYWEAADIVAFTYIINTNSNTGYWAINNHGPASESKYGTVKLADSADTGIDETDENTAASIPRIKNMIVADINKMRLGTNTESDRWTLQLFYDGNPIGSEEDLEKQGFPLLLSGMTNDGVKGVDNSRYLYKTDVNVSGKTPSINESGTILNINTVNASRLKGSLAGSYLDETSVTADKLATNAVIESKILNGSVTTNKLGPGAVTESKIFNGSVTTNKLGPGAVTEAKIFNGSVTDIKLAGGINGSKITNNTIPTDKIIGLDAYVKARIPKSVSFRIISYTGWIKIANNSAIESTDGQTIIKDSNWGAHISIEQTGMTPLAIAGWEMHGITNQTIPKLPVFQDMYLGTIVGGKYTRVYLAPQTAGNSGGTVGITVQVLYAV